MFINHIVNFVSDPIPNRRTEFSKHPSRNPIYILLLRGVDTCAQGTL